MKYKNYYEILGVNRKSTLQEIKLSYRKLAKIYHPDTNKDPEAEMKFKDVNEAYDTLTNDEKRRKYDRQVSKLGYGMTDSDGSLLNMRYEIKSGVTALNDMLNTILGFRKDEGKNFGDIYNGPKEEKKQQKQKPKRGNDIITSLEVTLEEGFYGAEKKLLIKGFSKSTILVNVPVGIKNGDKIRLAALGNSGKYGGKNGDLIIHVKLLKDENYILNGVNLEKTIEITPALAAVGGKFKVMLFNEKIFFDIPKHSNGNTQIIIKEKGYIKEDKTRGDLIIKLKINMPLDISEREEKLYEQLLKLENKKKQYPQI